MKILLNVICFATVLNFAAANSPEQSTTLKDQATECARIVLDENYELLPKYSHPKIITAMGGSERMIESVKQMIAQVNSQGIEFLDAEIGTPGPISKTSDGTLISLVPQKAIMTINGETGDFARKKRGIQYE